MIVAPNQKLPDVPFTIVGSGPASMTLALKLEEYGIPCLMLEAGGFDYTPESQDVYRAEVVGDALYDLAWNRLRYFGGTSGHWTGWCRPLDAEDLRSWPITHADLAGHLDEACRMLEIKGGFTRDRRVLPNFNQVEFQFSLPPVRFGQKYRQRIVESRLISVALNQRCMIAVAAGVLTPAQKASLTRTRNAIRPGDLQRRIDALATRLERLALDKTTASPKPVNRAFNKSLRPEVLGEATN